VSSDTTRFYLNLADGRRIALSATNRRNAVNEAFFHLGARIESEDVGGEEPGRPDTARRASMVSMLTFWGIGRAIATQLAELAGRATEDEVTAALPGRSQGFVVGICRLLNTGHLDEPFRTEAPRVLTARR
jgi:hypothetical protein